jgi:hypothetical protein
MGRSILKDMANSAPKFVIDWLKAAWEYVKPDVRDFLDKMMDKWMPRFIEAATVAMDRIGTKIANDALGAAAEGASRVEEQVTGAIPGQLDDRLSDTFVRPMLDEFRKRWGV